MKKLFCYIIVLFLFVCHMAEAQTIRTLEFFEDSRGSIQLEKTYKDTSLAHFEGIVAFTLIKNVEMQLNTGATLFQYDQLRYGKQMLDLRDLDFSTPTAYECIDGLIYEGQFLIVTLLEYDGHLRTCRFVFDREKREFVRLLF